MRVSLPILALLMLSACRTDPKPEDTGSPSEATDADGDGYADDVDCDDGDASVFPGAEELCNDVDDDCDGEIDEAGGTVWYPDADGDGYAGEDGSIVSCEAPNGYLDTAEDCDDDDATIHPGAGERCNGVDDDCDGEIDEDPPDVWYADNDEDGYGDATASTTSCDPGSGWVDNDGDCDDSDATIHPEALELCNGLDDDCDEEIDEGLDLTWYADADGDGYGDASVTTAACDAGSGWVDNELDCDDSNPSINPLATEVCDGLDNDCDLLTDDADAGVVDPATWYYDGDADGYGLEHKTVARCDQPSGYAALGGDCDDGDTAYNPGAAETDCTDPADYNCDGYTGYADDDGDGFAACEECDDLDATIFPGADERCDGVDNDCDAVVDEDDATDAVTWYADADGDGYGEPGSTDIACSQPSGFVADATDCDDGDGAVNPGATELCDGVDNDCDGSTDEDSAADASTWYADADGDGYGDAASTDRACSAPGGYVADASDCDDGDGDVHPGATETCSGVDDDCDGTVDEPADLLGSDAACGAVNCNEILSTRSSAPDGEYWLEFDGSSLQVFCDMTTAGGGWNVIHPDDMGNLGSLDAMRDELDTAMAYLRHSSGALYYTELFQLTAYAAYDVDVSDYDSTRTRVTFIPIGVAAVAGATQGFTSNGSELTFTNCDANPNSYIEFWHTGDSYAWSQDYTMSLMWRDSKLPASVAVPSDYFTFTAIHQGGCGTHSTSPYWVHYDGMQDAALAVR
jgi:hypothetical protein